MLHSVLLNKLVWCGEDFGQSGDSNPGQLQLLLRCGDQDFLVFVCVWAGRTGVATGCDSNLAKI